MASNKGNKKQERKQKMIRVIALILAGLMIFSAALAALLNQVF